MSTQGEDRPPFDEYADLLAAHANRDLTARQAQRLQDLVEHDETRRAEVEDLAVLHGLFAAERELRRRILGAPRSDEAQDPELRQLLEAGQSRLAARATELLATPPASVRPATPHSWRWRLARPAWFALAGAVATAILLWISLRGGGEPGLAERAPQDQRLSGTARLVLLAAEIDLAEPHLDWYPVLGAVRYDASVTDATGAVIVARPETAGPSTRWEFRAEELTKLQQHAGALNLRVVARDGMGLVVGTSHDLPLTLKRRR
ncbi:MAG: hypothetical protein IT458_12755 [Planctomycetes bacterium]|nr:hypothetical protein [Planctomycetota bacterium]